MVHQTPTCWGNPQSLDTSGRCHNLPYEKIGKNEPVCIADEVPFEIPESWEWVRLGNLTYNHGQKKPSSEFCYIDIGSIDNQHQRLNEKETIVAPENAASRARKIVKTGDILYSTVRPYLHNMCIIDREFTKEPIASTGFAVLKCCADYSNAFLFYYMMSPDFDNYANDSDNSKGVAYPAINDERLSNALIPVPPVMEQYRILNQLSKVLPIVQVYDGAYRNLENLSTTFPIQLKKSILQYAVQGKLVPQDPTDEPASALLECIRAEKEQLIKSGKVKRDKHESVIFRRDNSYYEKVDGIERCIDDDLPFEIPESWEWCRLGTILQKLTDGTHSTPKYTARGIPFISVKDISSGKISFERTKFISKTEHELLASRCDPHRDDILLTKVGTTGIPVLVDTDRPFSIFVSVAQLRFSTELLDKFFLIYLLKSPLVQTQCRENTKGVGNKNWVMRDIANTLICIPPLAEQKRIQASLANVLKSI